MATPIGAGRSQALHDLGEFTEAVKAAQESLTNAARAGYLPQRTRITVLTLATQLANAGYLLAAQRLRRYVGYATTYAHRVCKAERRIGQLDRHTGSRRVRTRQREHRSSSSRRTATATSGTSSGDPDLADSDPPRPSLHEGAVA